MLHGAGEVLGRPKVSGDPGSIPQRTGVSPSGCRTQLALNLNLEVRYELVTTMFLPWTPHASLDRSRLFSEATV